MSEVKKCPWCGESIENDIDTIKDLLCIKVRSVLGLCSICEKEISIKIPSSVYRKKCVIEKVEIF